MRIVTDESGIPLGYFSLSGQFDPNDITAQLGIQPSWVKRIGDAGPPDARGPLRGATWALTCEEDSASDVADQLIDLTYKLLPLRDRVVELAGRFNATFHIFSSSNYADWFLSPGPLLDLASLRVDIDCEHVRLLSAAQDGRFGHAD